MSNREILKQMRKNQGLGKKLLDEAARRIQEEPLKPGETKTVESTYERQEGNYKSKGYYKITIK
ncbi:hypothetical protein HN681_02150 [archaeon]|jgi:ribosomal protein S18 acetylase RimI-like enzyme|nr:hypothetical protein [archaeon]MBT3731378.1 hypothetical protein [archaeon]MBT4670319.1 hypothetical protein [archaeon]MBT5029663.1 hypothetical protein [archaeon]MBT5287588.1 hypothetical protein [archaeon]